MKVYIYSELLPIPLTYTTSIYYTNVLILYLYSVTTSMRVYNYSELRAIPLPVDVDPLHREHHLSDAEFNSVFGRTKSEFYMLSMDMQQSLKSSRGLL